MTAYPQNRWHFLDTLRGITLINMVLFHFFYDVFVIYGFSPEWNNRLLPSIWQQGICCTFILIAGIAFHLSRSPLKRGFQLNLWGALITLVTALGMPDETIWFGILNFMGCAILLTALSRSVFDRIKPVPGLVGSLLLFLLTKEIPNGYLGCYGWRPVRLPPIWYRFFPGAWLGFPPDTFYSSDYFPILPWIFLFWTGYFLYLLLKKYCPERILTGGKLPLLSYVGRKTLFVYLLHQPFCMLICFLLWG